MIETVRFLHVLFGTTLIGVIVAAFFYIIRSLQQGDRMLLQYSLKISRLGDLLILSSTIIVLVTAKNLVAAGHFSLAVPWILVAYLAFGMIILLWLSIVLLKYYYFSRMAIPQTALFFFYLFNIMLFPIFIVIIHDAVTRSTWFDFFLRS